MIAQLRAACHAAPHLSPEWFGAVRALGAYVKNLPAPKPGRPTGQTRGELYHQILRSHLFDADRQEWLSRWYASPSSTTFETMQAAKQRRAAAESQLKKAAKATQPA